MGAVALAVPAKSFVPPPKGARATEVIFALAEAAGMPTRRHRPNFVKRGNDQAAYWKKGVVEVNHRTCIARTVRSFNLREKDRVAVTFNRKGVESVKFGIVYVDVPGFAPRSYVVPTHRLLENAKTGKTFRFTVLLEPPEDYFWPSVAWGKYRGAWHLLCLN